jgi:hypothetical protein
MNILSQPPPFAGRQQNRMINPLQQPNMAQPDGGFDMTQFMGYLRSRYPGIDSMQLGQFAEGQAGFANDQRQQPTNQSMQARQQQPRMGGNVLGMEAQQSRGMYGNQRRGTSTRSIF